MQGDNSGNNEPARVSLDDLERRLRVAGESEVGNAPSEDVKELSSGDAGEPENDIQVRYLGQLAEEEVPGSRVTHYLARIGFQLTIALLVLIAGVFLWVGVYAFFTQPPPLSELRQTFPNDDTTAVFDNYEKLQTAWFGQIKDLLQILVVSLLIPLVATVIGYIFGRREDTTDQSGE
jgi:hypothetical protein